jgi:hypothetical protein
MVKAAIRDLGGATTNVAVRKWIQEKYPGTNRSTINCQMIAGCVNHPSRVHYAVDVRPRAANNQELDRYFRPARGHIEEYSPPRHGQWEIFQLSALKASVRESPNGWPLASELSLMPPPVVSQPKVRSNVTAGIAGNKGEVTWMYTLQPLLELALQSLSSSCVMIRVDAGCHLPYACEIRHYEEDTPKWSNPARYQTDLLVYDEFAEDGIWIPRVVIECKIKGVTTHDALTYSAKAATHKHLHPYLRYGMLIGSYGSVVPARLVRHGAHFDFMAVWDDANPAPGELETFIGVLKEEIEASRILQQLLADKTKARGSFRMIHRPLVFKT